MTANVIVHSSEIEAEMENERYQRLIKNQDKIISLLRKKGYRITRQRELLINVIISHDCASCKEIYYQATKVDPTIGMATVYRIINILTDIGVLCPSSIKPILEDGSGNGCTILFDNSEVIDLSQKEWVDMLEFALWKKGIHSSGKISKVTLK